MSYQGDINEEVSLSCDGCLSDPIPFNGPLTMAFMHSLMDQGWEWFTPSLTDETLHYCPNCIGGKQYYDAKQFSLEH